MYHNPICNGLTILLYYRWLRLAGYQPQRYNFYSHLRKIENIFLSPRIGNHNKQFSIESHKDNNFGGYIHDGIRP
jgi:hypothetical protein